MPVGELAVLYRSVLPRVVFPVYACDLGRRDLGEFQYSAAQCGRVIAIHGTKLHDACGPKRALRPLNALPPGIGYKQKGLHHARLRVEQSRPREDVATTVNT